MSIIVEWLYYRMEFIESIVVSSFDIIFILSELTVDGIGYAAWLLYVLVSHKFFFFTFINVQLSAVLLETIRVIKVDAMRDIDAKEVIPHLPILGLFRSVRIRHSAIEMSPGWKKVSR